MEQRRRYLTPRQVEVLTLVANGWTTQQIADKLGFSCQTVNDSVNAACLNLGARNRTHAAAMALCLNEVDAYDIDLKPTHQAPEVIHHRRIRYGTLTEMQTRIVTDLRDHGGPVSAVAERLGRTPQFISNCLSDAYKRLGVPDVRRAERHLRVVERAEELDLLPARTDA